MKTHAPARRGREIIHVEVEHGDGGRGVFDEQSQLVLAASQTLQRGLFLRDIADDAVDLFGRSILRSEMGMKFDPAFGAIVGAADATGRFENARSVGALRRSVGGVESATSWGWSSRTKHSRVILLPGGSPNSAATVFRGAPRASRSARSLFVRRQAQNPRSFFVQHLSRRFRSTRCAKTYYTKAEQSPNPLAAGA